MLPKNDIETLVDIFAELRDMVDRQRVSGAAGWPYELVNNLSTISGALQELTSSTLNLFRAGINPSEQLSMLSYIQEIREEFNAGLFGTWRDVVNSSRLPEPPILLDVFVATLADRMRQLGDVLEKCRDAMYVSKPDAVSDEQYSTKKSMYDTFARSMLNANLIYNRLENYKNGINAAPTEPLPEGENTTVETVAGPVFGVYVNRTEDDIVILERIPDKKLVQVYMDDREHRDLYDINREYEGKEVTVSSGGVVPLHQPEVDIALQRAMEDSQSAIHQQMKSKTPVGKGGLTVLICANTGKGADNRWKEIWERNIRTVTYPEGSVLVGHPESPFCARMYRHKEDQKVVLLAEAKSRSALMLINENGETVMPVDFSIKDCELMTPEESRAEWKRFGYHTPDDSATDAQRNTATRRKTPHS